MKTIIKKNGLKILFSTILIFSLVTALPGNNLKIYAAPLEDCDLDGYDDATGVKVPWPGYDETKGDTPDGPGGKTSGNTNPSSGGAASGGSGTTPSSGSTNPGSGGSTNTGNGVNTNPGSGGNTSPSSGGTASGNTSSTSPTSTGKTSSDNTDSSTSAQTDDQSTADEPVSTSAEDLGSESIALAETQTIINTKGALKIREVQDGIIHAGSSIIISGTGFSSNIDGFKIEIHSEPQYLGTTVSSEDGSFELKIQIPENLEAGTHNIVVLYQGKEIMRQQIEVGPKAVDSFWEALSVGFSADNAGLVPGLLILAGLVIAGTAALLANRFIHFRRSVKAV